MEGLFFIVEEIMLYFRSLERDLKLDRINLDDNEFWTKLNRSKIEDLLVKFKLLIQENSDNPRIIKLIRKVKGLNVFLENLRGAYEKDPSRAESQLQPVVVVNKINAEIDEIQAFIKSWKKTIKEKVSFVEKNNKHLENLPIHSNPEMFYVMVKELNPVNLVTKHGLHPDQAKNIEELSDSQLTDYNKKDPIAGRRVWKKTDLFSFPGSVIVVKQGHHRIYEVYRRYLLDKIDGDKLIEFVKSES